MRFLALGTMGKPLYVHPEARLEAQEAYDYLAVRNLSAATRFADQIRSAYDDIEQQPGRFPQYQNRTERYKLLQRFPYVVVYVEMTQEIIVYAVAHTSRKPGYWKERTR